MLEYSLLKRRNLPYNWINLSMSMSSKLFRNKLWNMYKNYIIYCIFNAKFNIWFQIIVNACFSAPCLNGGTCSRIGSTYNCQCATGYSGVNCQICNYYCWKLIPLNWSYKFLLLKDDACSSNPCINGATCQTNGNGFICICLQYFSGTTCQTCN